MKRTNTRKRIHNSSSDSDSFIFVRSDNDTDTIQNDDGPVDTNSDDATNDDDRVPVLVDPVRPSSAKLTKEPDAPIDLSNVLGNPDDPVDQDGHSPRDPEYSGPATEETKYPMMDDVEINPSRIVASVTLEKTGETRDVAVPTSKEWFESRLSLLYDRINFFDVVAKILTFDEFGRQEMINAHFQIRNVIRKKKGIDKDGWFTNDRTISSTLSVYALAVYSALNAALHIETSPEVEAFEWSALQAFTKSTSRIKVDATTTVFKDWANALKSRRLKLSTEAEITALITIGLEKITSLSKSNVYPPIVTKFSLRSRVAFAELVRKIYAQ